MEHRKGANTVSMHVVVVLKLNKTAKINGKKVKNPFEEVHKEEWVSGMIQFKYQTAVENQQKREGLVPLYVKGKSWHHVVKRDSGHLSPFSMHKDIGAIEYMRVRKNNVFGTNYFDTEGREVLYSQIEPFISKKKDKHNVPFRVYKLDSIVDVKIDGRIYTMKRTA
jgi:hypothetical protein